MRQVQALRSKVYIYNKDRIGHSTKNYSNKVFQVWSYFVNMFENILTSKIESMRQSNLDQRQGNNAKKVSNGNSVNAKKKEHNSDLSRN